MKDNCINPKLKTEVKNAGKVKAVIGFLVGIKLYKFKSLKSFRGAFEIIIRKRTKVHLGLFETSTALFSSLKNTT